MTGIQTYAEYVAKKDEIIGRNFHAVPPAETIRSTGLDPQCGLIVGLKPAPDIAVALAELLGGLPSAWSVYTNDTLHLTLGDRVEKSGATPDDGFQMDSLPMAFGIAQQRVDEVALAARLYAIEPALTDMKLLVSRDTIILVGRPNEEIYRIRHALTGPTSMLSVAGVRCGWGSHITLARLIRPLDDTDVKTTTEWLLSTSPPARMDLPRIVAGSFSVTGDRFGFDETYEQLIK